MRHAFFHGLVLLICLVSPALPSAAGQDGGLTPAQIRDAASRVMQNSDFNGVRRRVLENVPADQLTSDGFLLETLRSAGSSVGDFFEWLFRDCSPVVPVALV